MGAIYSADESDFKIPTAKLKYNIVTPGCGGCLEGLDAFVCNDDL